MDTSNTVRKQFFHLTVAVLITAALILCFGMTVSAASNPECDYIKGNNINSNDYSVWSSPIKSYLVKDGAGYMRVQGLDDGGIAVAYYDSDFNVTSRRTISKELPLFGGFYATSDYYFLVTGQNNPNESNSTEVFRITKYNRSWSRLGSCSLYGANTYEPFSSGSCRMAMDGNYLLIRTCHTMYYSDGAHHQANVTIEVNTSNMTVTDSYTKIWNVNGGYVSHSFNQFIRIDNNHKIVAVDHGDARPRSICLMRYPTNVTSGKFSTDTGVTTTDIISFPEATGGGYSYNYTGASVGALELIGSNYLIAGNSVARFSNTTSGVTRNIFVASSSGGIKWLTSYSEGEETVTTPHMVKLDNSRFMVLWSREEEGKVYYTFINADGNMQGSIYSMAGQLSDCAPIYDSGKVIWYTYKDGKEDFYVIPVSSPANAKVTHRKYGHDYTFVSVNNGVATVKCSRCGEETTGNVPTRLYVGWTLTGSSGGYSSADQHIPFGKTAGYWAVIDGGDDSWEGNIFSELEFIPSDTANVIVDTDKERVSFQKAGKYTVKVRLKYNPSIGDECTFYVYTPLKSVSLKLYSEGTLKAGTEVIVGAIPDGGGYIGYDFKITTPTGRVLSHTQYDLRGVAITAVTPGTYTVVVTASNLSDSTEPAVISAPLEFVVEPSPDTADNSDSNSDTADSSDSNSDTYKADQVKEQLGADGTAVGKGASAATADKAIRNATSEEGPAGTKFTKLRLRSTKQTKKSITLKWAKVPGAAKYVIYGTKCGKTNKMKKLFTVTGTSRKITKAAGKKLVKGKYYKFIAVALDSNDNVISTSKVVHVATKGGKDGNYKSITIKKTILKKAQKLKKGKTLSLKAKAVRASKLKVSVHRAVRYESTNKKIATVTNKGVVKAKKKGSCYIYAYTQNGVYKKIKITVK